VDFFANTGAIADSDWPNDQAPANTASFTLLV